MYNFMHRPKVVYSFSIKDAFCMAIILCFCTLISACASPPKAYSIRGDGDKILNRDTNGKSLSVVVRIYQLKDAREFSKLTFDTLADGRPESELLGPALLDKSDAVVVPGGSYVSTEKLLEDTKFVGIVAFFRQPDQHYWRQLVAAEAIRSQGLAFKVQDCYITVTGIKPVALPGQPASALPDCEKGNLPAARQSVRPSSSSNQPQATPNAGRGQKRSGSLPGIPDVNVNANTPLTPTSAQVSSDGVSAISIGGPAPTPTYYGAPR